MSVLAELEPVDSDNQVEIGHLESNPEDWGSDKRSFVGDLKALKSRDWIRYWNSAGGEIGSVIVDPPGKDAANEFNALRSDPERRARAARDAVLTWLDEQYHSGLDSPNIGDFMKGAHGNYLGHPFADREVTAATRWLKDEGYLEGQAAHGGPVLRPKITNKGLASAETGNSTSSTQTPQVGDIYNIHNAGAFNWAQNSSNVIQSNTLTQGQIDQVEKMVGSVRALLNPDFLGTTETTVAEAQEVVAEIEGELHSPAPEPSKVKALAFKLMELAATGTVQGAVDAVTAVVQRGIADM